MAKEDFSLILTTGEILKTKIISIHNKYIQHQLAIQAKKVYTQT
jgi:hypothetical protein